MAKNIWIKEDGLLKAFNAEKLRVKNTDGTKSLWIPLDGTATAEKIVNSNGTYNAAAQGYYGYSKVTVDVASSQAVGTLPDGNIYSVTVDDEGYLVEKMLPSSINIETPPTKTTYQDGETIDKTGMVVKAYDGNGNLWTDTDYPNGIIPNSEITLDPEKASSGGGWGSAGDIYTDGNGLNARKLNYIGDDLNPTFSGYHNYYGASDNRYPWIYTDETQYSNAVYLTQYNGRIYAAFSQYSGMLSFNTGGATSLEARTVFKATPMYTNDPQWATVTILCPESTVDPTDKSVSTLYPSGQTITAKWPRPNDYSILTDTFNISVSGS